MMPSKTIVIAHRVSRALTALSALACTFVIAYGGVQYGSDLFSARLIREKTPEIAWKSIRGADITKGVNLPANTHIVFQMPEGILDIQREVLLGKMGPKVRYWGYCIPQNEDEDTIAARTGLPGLIFLSEAERAARAKLEQENRAKEAFSVNDLPSPEKVREEALRQAAGPQKGAIRHQVEVFSAEMLCYIMTEKALPMALDTDKDGLNDQLEREAGANPKSGDSDSDGLKDEIEYVTGTSMTLRDTDSDGLIDGIEDKNFNGRVNAGETDPRVKDSDRDELCDGLCRFKIKRQEYYIGEDKNLNGKIDKGETDPLKPDTDKDGMPDNIEYLNCLVAGKKNCPEG